MASAVAAATCPRTPLADLSAAPSRWQASRMHPERWASRANVPSPGVPSALALVVATRVVDPAMRLLHRPRFEGLEHLPERGPYLLVANHSGGIALAELHCFVALWARHFGRARPLAGFAHPVGFGVWPLSWVLRQIGAIPSSYSFARDALGRGVPLLIFPGGDHEGMRPVWQAHRVDFGGRKGFLRIAAEARVPIVPLGIRGSHFTAPLLGRSRWLAWLALWPLLVGVKRWTVSVLGLAGALILLLLLPASLPVRVALSWVWLASPLSLLPVVPATITFRFGAPLAPEVLFGQQTSPGEPLLAESLSRVERTIEALVRAPRA